MSCWTSVCKICLLVYLFEKCTSYFSECAIRYLFTLGSYWRYVTWKGRNVLFIIDIEYPWSELFVFNYRTAQNTTEFLW